MRFILLLSLLLVVTATSAWAAPLPESVAYGQLKRGTRALADADLTSAVSRKLVLLEHGLIHLRRARATLRVNAPKILRSLDRQIERALIRGLSTKARIYLERGSLRRAQRAVRAAMAYSIADLETLKLHAAIHRALMTDVYETIQGQRAIERLRDRHEELGAPLRDRGAARRR